MIQLKELPAVCNISEYLVLTILGINTVIYHIPIFQYIYFFQIMCFNVLTTESKCLKKFRSVLCILKVVYLPETEKISKTTVFIISGTIFYAKYYEITKF